MLLTEEGLWNHHSLSTLEHECAVIAEELVKSVPETEVIRTTCTELLRKAVILSSNYKDSLQSFYACHSTTAEFGMSDSEMEEMEGKRTVLTVRMETYLNSVESTVHAALKCCASIMILQETLNEFVPHVRDYMTRSMQQETSDRIH